MSANFRRAGQRAHDRAAFDQLPLQAGVALERASVDCRESIAGQRLCAADAVAHVCAGIFAIADDAERARWLSGGVSGSSSAGAVVHAGVYAVAGVSALASRE